MVLKTIKIEVFCDLCHAKIKESHGSKEALVGLSFTPAPPTPPIMLARSDPSPFGSMYVESVSIHEGEPAKKELSCLCNRCYCKINEVLNQQKALRGSTHPVTGEDL